MARNEVYRVGQYVPAPLPDTAPGSGVPLGFGVANSKTGVPLRIGALNLVTVTRKGEDNYAQNGSVDLAAAHLLPVTVVGSPATFGQAVYLVTASGLLSTASAGATYFGNILDESPVAVGAQVPCIVRIGQTSV